MSSTFEKVRGGLVTKLYYGFGSVAFGVKDNGFAFFLLLYYNQVLGLPAQWVGGAILFALAVDAISDPIIGYISDNLHSRWGRRHPFMYASALPVAVSFYFLWNPPSGLDQNDLLTYLIVMAVLVRTFITLYEIPSSSLVAELTDDYDERTSMLGFRYFFGWWGGLCMAITAYFFLLRPTPEYPIGQLNPAGWQAYGAIASVVMFIAILVSAIGTHRHIPFLHRPPAKHQWSTRKTLSELGETLSNRSFLVLFVSAIFGAMAAGISTSLNIYFNTFFWELTANQMGMLAFGPLLSSAVALAAAPALARRMGKKAAAITIYGLAIVIPPIPILGRLLDFMPVNGSPTLMPVLLFFVIIEVTLIVTASILMASMVADTVEESAVATGRRSEGVFFAARSFIQKSVHGIGVMVATGVLTAIEFPEGAKPGEVDPSVIASLGWIYVPLLFSVYLLSLLFVSAYRISRASHAENVARLAEQGTDGG
ncbi:MAG: GPH family glycoside/pentoside/hexuronide:cation symporter [Hyphomicrobiaceae bacterium]|jgi:GPH family glycoside/pentoside/hexuronide:cation symporter